MPVKITKKKKNKKQKQLLQAATMLLSSNSYNHIFQKYFKGEPKAEYYINCGANEPAVICAYKDNEKWKLKTYDIEMLHLVGCIVVDVTNEVEISITIEETI